MRTLIVCVGYADLLAKSLPYNLDRLGDGPTVVVTSPQDHDTRDLCRRLGVLIWKTEAFYKDGATFNKWAALEEALDAIGRRGWICFLDADILWPKALRFGPDVLCDTERIYGLDNRRLLLDTDAKAPPEEEWGSLPLDPMNAPDGTAPHSEVMGYTQVFHASASVLGPPPWHDVTIPHAGLGDSKFQCKWGLSKKTWLPFQPLHLGALAENWCGRGKKTETDQLKHQIWGGGAI